MSIITSAIYIIVLLLLIFGIPFVAAGIIRLILHFTKCDKKKANVTFWIILIVFFILWVFFGVWNFIHIK